jgi:hypothetical protein
MPFDSTFAAKAGRNNRNANNEEGKHARAAEETLLRKG